MDMGEGKNDDILSCGDGYGESRIIDTFRVAPIALWPPVVELCNDIAPLKSKTLCCTPYNGDTVKKS